MQWKIGPFEVIDIISLTTYKLQLPDSFRGHNIFNLQHLAKHHRSPDKEQLNLVNPRNILPSTEEYEVDRIVGD